MAYEREPNSWRIRLRIDVAAVGQVPPGDGSWPVHVGLSTAVR
ncbi:hypothetical protein RISK_004916 [Rhodopirellula islandica]|uniref:Uncharacterized protein n=1 Tax=Rhodopirellula islandica TaxID=595434 RepID=A0A0J1B8J8_RHOIS|nr:hypothetical protein RISK_004916 [Rhodopirellula islandica]